MHELEFLPAWYPRLRRRKRLVTLQGVMTLLIILGLSLWMVLARRNVRDAEMALRGFEVQMQQTETEKRQLEDQLRIKTQLEQREQMVAALGFPVEMSRLLRTFDEIMPREMSLKEITCKTVEQQPQPPSGHAAARATQDKPALPDRRLEVNLVGVAPNDVDLANFLAGLTRYPFLEDTALVRARELSDAGHLMREFEVSFSISLNALPGQ